MSCYFLLIASIYTKKYLYNKLQRLISFNMLILFLIIKNMVVTSMHKKSYILDFFFFKKTSQFVSREEERSTLRYLNATFMQ